MADITTIPAGNLTISTSIMDADAISSYATSTFLQLTGGTLSGNLAIGSSNKINPSESPAYEEQDVLAVGVNNVIGSKCYVIIGIDKNEHSLTLSGDISQLSPVSANTYAVSLKSNTMTYFKGNEMTCDAAAGKVFLADSDEIWNVNYGLGKHVNATSSELIDWYVTSDPKNIKYNNAFFCIEDQDFGNMKMNTVGNVASGWRCKSLGKYAHAEGRDALALANDAHAEGNTCTARGLHSHAEGNETFAFGNGAHSEGNHTYAIKEQSHAEGYLTYATGTNAHAEGGIYENNLSGSTASGESSHAEGRSTKALSSAAHAEGDRSIAYAVASHAEGMDTFAGGHCSHAEGNHTSAFGKYSHSAGFLTIARDDNQFVWNGISSETYDTSSINAVGSFCINPLNDISGFYIGTQNLAQIIQNAVQNSVKSVLSSYTLNGDTALSSVLSTLVTALGGTVNA